MSSLTSQQDYPGQRRGLPQAGPGAVAGWGRRVGALAIDWVLSMLAVGAFVGQDIWGGEGAAQWAPLLVFFLEVSILTGLVGASAGQLITGVVIRRTSRTPVGLWRAIVRTALICLVIPPVIYNKDQQGLHDLAVDSIALRR